MPGNTREDSSANLMDGSILAGLLAAVRSHRPLVHHITNSVTINDCANITISAGAAPVMAEAPEEVAEMVSAAGALVLNIGTLSQGQVDAMLIAGRRANVLGIPVILDPVGAGATRFRTETAWRLLDSLDVAVLKGNAGEIGVLAGTGGSVRGVDSGGIAGDPVETVRECARATGTVVAMTGPVDVVAEDRRVFLVGNGNPMMDRLSGTGCMAASVTGAFAAIADDYAVSSAAALAAFGLAGERAAAGARGPYSFRTALFDELSVLTPGDLAEHARLEGPHGV
ncbi:hydroxyethylthiazole kinase [Methanoculleus bourgensis]|jgi:hydroxyethylthiazole kinase|uniref:Hydroxyethylthiazole kinase n=4 Tax=Methanoculleus TaxID=45989 RepID=A0A0X3BH05_9EURY|nr:hydroxyethylthiazole kinase [Methanoculleus bourgensis]MDD3372901.1 hydroxyethylthiazole kinase [Methanoculleus bourgensis]CVK31408.1 Hydroxyethylthiazole kinase [Methanoculleus bourgensis]SAI87092.1 hydroxyethylthiazole kinase [Methanoculleus bourgensis]